MDTYTRKVDYPAIGKAAKVTPDKWLDKLAAELRSPAKVALAAVALAGFVWFVVAIVTGG